MKRIFSVILSTVLVATLLSACGEKEVPDFNKESVTSVQSGVVAQNEKLSLIWNDEDKFITLLDKATNKNWSTIPYDYYQSGGTSNNVRAPITITAVNSATAQWETISGYSDAVSKGRVATENIKNGIEVTYYFDNYSISVPVKYILSQSGLKVSVETDKIVEAGDLKLAEISVAPFLCSAPNVKSDDTYIFVPSGSGGLMYCDQRPEGTRKFTGEVYGKDASCLVPEEPTDTVNTLLPVYGIKDGDSALLAVIDEGAESSRIYAETGNKRTGYSTVYSTFVLRGYDIEASEQWMWAYQDLKKVSDNKSSADLSIIYTPLSGEKANYNAMAEHYREYLEKSGKMTKSDITASSYALNILGGVTYKTTRLGLPYRDLSVLTTFNEAREILSELEGSPAVVLEGFSDTGVDIGKPAGGFKLGKDFGSAKDLKALVAEGEKLSALGFDFDIIKYSKSGSGFSYTWDSAKSATLHTVEKAGVEIPLRSYNKDEYHLLKRSNLAEAVQRLEKLLKKENMSAVALGTLSNIAYSDYDSEDFAVKGNTEKQTSELISSLKKQKINIMGKAVNGYFANKADLLLDTPQDNGEYFVLDRSIPFYQMVYGGNKPMYSTAVNLASDSQKLIMQAVSAGMGLSYTVAYDYDRNVVPSVAEQFYGVKFADIQEDMKNTVSQYSEYYAKIKDSRIMAYEFLEEGITKTTFNNGVCVYANHNNSEAEFEGITLAPYGTEIRF